MSERYPKCSLKIWYMEISFNTNNWLSKDTDEEQLMHSKSENIEIMIVWWSMIKQMKFLKNFLNDFFLDIKST